MNKRQRKKQAKKQIKFIQRAIQWVEAVYEKMDRKIKADPEAMKEFFLQEPQSSVVDLLIRKCEREIRKQLERKTLL